MTNEKVLPTPAEVKALREKAGLSLQEMADLFNIERRSWQAKEAEGKYGRQLTWPEYQYLLLITNQHPEFEVTRR